MPKSHRLSPRNAGRAFLSQCRLAGRALSLLCWSLGRLATAQPAAEATPAREIVISVPDQLLAMVEGDSASVFPISTSKYGLGDTWGSYKTPLGRFRICEKLGAKLPLGAVIKHRSATGEILAPNAPGRDPIVTRIIWLEGLEPRNSHARERAIYIHGTTEEDRLGQPVSWGCVRMRSLDVAKLFEHCGLGGEVTIANAPLAKVLQEEFGDSLAECPALPGCAARVSVPITADGPLVSLAPDPVPRPWLRLTLAASRAPVARDLTDLRYTSLLQIDRPLARGWQSMGVEDPLLGRVR